MADKKLNEVTKVTDMAYVPVIMSDGSIGQIAKADLASVVAGLLGNPISHKGVLSNVDIDSVTETGVYLSQGVTNRPMDGVWSIFEVYRVNNNVCQRFNAIGLKSESTVRTGTISGGSVTWNNWSRIDNFGYNTLADLATGVAGVMGEPVGRKNSSSTNLNEYIENGIYPVNTKDSFLNLPKNANGFVVVLKSEARLSQTFSIPSTDETYIRTAYLSGSWVFGAWRRIDNFGCNSLEELAASLKPLM